jgi:hypothetical protein
MAEEQPEESTTQKLQNKVDKLKLLNLTSNIHNLTPPQQKEEDPTRDIQLVRALSVSPRIAMKFLEIRGLEYDEKNRNFVQVTEPIMNTLGAYRFCKILKMAEEIEWASYSEEEINSRIIHFFEENIPYVLFWAPEYDLNARDYNYVITTLQAFIDTSFHKSKSGKYINTLGRTYSEDTLKRALDTSEDKSKKEGGFMSKWNPFKDKK